MGTSFEDLPRTPPADGPLRDAWPLRTFLDLAPLPTAAPCAGLHARAVIGEWRLGRLRDTAEVAVTALVASAVRVCAQIPGRPPLRLRLRCDGVRVLAVVKDASSRPPVPLGTGGRGESSRLALSARQLAADWGWMPVEGGKLCWCLMRLQAVGRGQRGGRQHRTLLITHVRELPLLLEAA
jgi:hypothetical protein